MTARLIYRAKSVFNDGAILELVIWLVPEPVPGSKHSYKYRLYYGVGGRRVVGFDNERMKGDHCHLDGREHAYAFTTVETLIEDFLREVRQRRQGR